MVQPGDDLATVVLTTLANSGFELRDGDVLVLAQKIVSKAEHRQINLADVSPGAEAEALARETDKDPRLVQLILDESTEVLRKKPGVLIVRHKLGLVGANAGIDQSNIDHDRGATTEQGGQEALLLPADPDESARKLMQAISKHTGKAPGIIIADSMNRPWRLGTIGGAIGCAGVSVLDDHRGGHDIYGRELKVTLINRADALAGAATLLMGETTEKIPLVLIRGVAPYAGNDSAADIPRDLDEDMFR
jgi:coenzyme F420-0:L-glutamate ligase/coenzyme F420-1:gamma-L-glutamate ligase